MSTQPYRNVAYGLSEALLNVAQAPIIAQRNPTTTDRAQLGTEWINQTNDDVWILVKVEDNISTWVLITSGAGGGVQSLDGDTGNAVPTGGIITIAGAGDVTTAATGSTVTVTGSGVDIFDTESGTATGSSNTILISGGNGITTSGSGSTVTITASASVPLTFDGDTGTAIPATNAITMHGAGDITTSASGSTVTFTGSGVDIFDTGSGTATGSSNTILISGGTGIATTGSGSTVTITATGSFASPVTVPNGGTGDTSFTPYAVITGGTTSTGPLQNVVGLGTSGEVLTSNGAAALPSWQAASGSSGIVTIDGNSGSVTGSTVTVTTGAANANGTAKFTGSSTTMTQTFDDSNGNLALGTSALAGGSFSGSFNTCLGKNSGVALTSGVANVYIGYQNSINATTGQQNTVIGYQAATNFTTGVRNTIVGAQSGGNYTGAESDNVLLGRVEGVLGESNTLHIGTSTGTANGELNAAYICGIQGITVTGTAVLVSSSDQLGIAVSSKRFKNDIQDMESASEVLYKLRPVTFTWNRNSSPGLKDATQARQCGLIAEEVAPLLPQVVGFDKSGNPLNINYGDLTSLLVNEIQKLNTRILALEAQCQKG